MSVTLMAKVWTLNLGGGDQGRSRAMVLMALADHADDNGLCYPSAAYLGWKTGYSERQIKRILDQLEADKVIEVAREHTNTTPRIYRLTLDGIPEKQKYERKPSGRGSIYGTAKNLGVTLDKSRGDIEKSWGDIEESRGDIAVSPEPSLEPPVQPPEEVTAKSAVTARPKSLYPIARALVTVCGDDFKANDGRIFKEAQRLARSDLAPTSELILEKYSPGGWWYREDWRGKKGERPTPAAVRETWGKWNLPQVKTEKPGLMQSIRDGFSLYNEVVNGVARDDPKDTGRVLVALPQPAAE